MFRVTENAARLDEAITRNQETTIEFTGPELNHLLSRQSDLSWLRGRSRIEIADSTMTVALSAPLSALPWPGLKDRWFNGTLRFSMTYGSGTFQLEIISAEANGNEFPNSFLRSIINSRLSCRRLNRCGAFCSTFFALAFFQKVSPQ